MTNEFRTASTGVPAIFGGFVVKLMRRRLESRRSDHLSLFGRRLFYHLHQRRDWTAERVGDGAQELGLVVLHDPVGRHRVRTGIEDLLLQIGTELIEPVQRA